MNTPPPPPPASSNTASSNKGSKKKAKKQKSSSNLSQLFLSSWVIPLVVVVGISVGISVLYGLDLLPGFEGADPEVQLTYRQSLEIGSGALKLMWATPIFTINLYNNSRMVGTDFNTRAFNLGLKTAVMKEFNKFLAELEKREGKEGHSQSGSSAKAYNELFFASQRDSWEKTGRTALDKYGEYSHMKNIMQSAATTFLDMTGRTMPDRVDMFAWGTVHRECMFHLAHTHPHNLVSGVYYARVPDGAGDIIFEDPRGPLPPFENRIIHTPKEGDLIVFPSWLLHQVSPTHGKEERISFSFNILGDWTQTADVSLTIPFS